MAEELNVERLREDDIIALGPCAKCHKKLMEGAAGALVPFYVVTVATALTDPNALRRRVGLGLQIGDALAKHMGPDEPLAVVLPGTRFFLHQSCMLEMEDLPALVEGVNDRAKDAARAKTD